MIKEITLAKLYRGEHFMGFGLAVNGKLLERQACSNIESLPCEDARLHVTFNLTKEMVENAVNVAI